MKIVCPLNPNHKKFSVSAHEVHNWTVDENGNFVKDNGCTDMIHRPDKHDNFSCESCGSDGKVVE